MVGTTITALTPLVEKGDHRRRRGDAQNGRSRRGWRCCSLPAWSASSPPTCAASSADGSASTCSTTSAARSTRSCSGSTSPATTSCRPGQLVSRASSDVNLVQGLLSFLPIMIGNVLLFVLSLVIVMLILSPLLTLVALAVGPLLLVRRAEAAHVGVPRDLGRAAAGGRRRRRRRRGRRRRARGEGLRAGAARARQADRPRHDGCSPVACVPSGSRRKYQPTLQAIPVLGQVAILALGGWLVIDGTISLGTFLAFSTYLAQLTVPGADARRPDGRRPAGPRRRRAHRRPARRAPAIVDKPDADRPRRRCAARCASTTCASATSATEPGARRLRLTDRTRRDRRAGRHLRLRASRPPPCSLPRFYDVQGGAVRIDGVDVRDVDPRVAAPPDRRGLRGQLPVLRHGAGQHRLRPARGDRRGGRPPPPRPPRPTSSSSPCPTATTPWSASRA